MSKEFAILALIILISLGLCGLLINCFDRHKPMIEFSKGDSKQGDKKQCEK